MGRGLVSTITTSLWVARNGAHKVYLAGTIHLLRASDYPLPRAFDAAYANSTALYFELDYGDPEQSGANITVERFDALMAIEQAFGRARPFPNAARTLDLDLILHGGDIVVEQGLEVPHPRFRERFFVLGPLAEIAPDMVDPVSGMRVAELLRALLRDSSR